MSTSDNHTRIIVRPFGISLYQRIRPNHPWNWWRENQARDLARGLENARDTWACMLCGRQLICKIRKHTVKGNWAIVVILQCTCGYHWSDYAPTITQAKQKARALLNTTHTQYVNKHGHFIARTPIPGSGTQHRR